MIIVHCMTNNDHGQEESVLGSMYTYNVSVTVFPQIEAHPQLFLSIRGNKPMKVLSMHI